MFCYKIEIKPFYTVACLCFHLPIILLVPNEYSQPHTLDIPLVHEIVADSILSESFYLLHLFLEVIIRIIIKDSVVKRKEIALVKMENNDFVPAMVMVL